MELHLWKYPHIHISLLYYILYVIIYHQSIYEQLNMPEDIQVLYLYQSFYIMSLFLHLYLSICFPIVSIIYRRCYIVL